MNQDAREIIAASAPSGPHEVAPGRFPAGPAGPGAAASERAANGVAPAPPRSSAAARRLQSFRRSWGARLIL